MANINLAGLTNPNGAAKFDDIIYKNFIANTPLNNVFKIMEGVKNGDKVVGVKPFRILGKKSQGCNPEYENSLMPTVEKTWDIAEWDIPQEICYDDLKGSIVDEVLNTGINSANVIDTRYYKEIIEPGIIDGIEKLHSRLAFFGSKTMSAGELQEADDLEYFNLIDGVWKQIFDAVAKGTIKNTAIAANSKTTIAQQMSAFTAGSGDAVKLVHSILTEAPIGLRQASNKVLYMTQALFDAYAADKQAKFVGSESQWETLESGITTGKINGIDVMVLPDWDYNIQNFLKNTTNVGAYDKPFRAILTVKDNLLLGTESDGDFKTFIADFDAKNQVNWILAKNTLGAMVHFDELVHVAY